MSTLKQPPTPTNDSSGGTSHSPSRNLKKRNADQKYFPPLQITFKSTNDQDSLRQSASLSDLIREFSEHISPKEETKEQKPIKIG